MIGSFHQYNNDLELSPLPDGSDIVGGELALTDFGIGVIRKEHGSDPVGDDSRLFQLFVIFADVVESSLPSLNFSLTY